jgi:hypothetical protein
VWSPPSAYGTTGLSVGQRAFGLTDRHRDGTLAEYAAVEARPSGWVVGVQGGSVRAQRDHP